MITLPQPPPDVPEPPPGATVSRSRRILFWLGVIGVSSVAILAALPMVVRQRHSCGQTEAMSNARQIGLAMFEFETEYGSFPNATTMAKVRATAGSTWSPGTVTSNDYFRQLIASNIAGSEVMFFARSKWNKTKPDNRFLTEAECLKKGDCGFTYFLGARIGGNSGRPLIAATMIPGTDRFDREVNEGKAVILLMDNSVTSLPIDKDGHAIMGGRNMMDPGHPIWEGNPPAIAWPDL